MTIEAIQARYNTEIALVILCCRVYLGTEQPQTLKAFIQQHKINWVRVYELCAIHRIRPVIFRELDTIKELVDENTLERFRSFCFHFVSGALNRKQEADKILAILRQNDIKARLYKGIDFARVAYGDIAMREFADNDLIIQQKDIPAIIRVMEKEGYEMREKDFYTRFPKRFLIRHKDIVFHKKLPRNAALTFEFHFKPVAYFSIPVPDFTELLGKDYLSPNRSYTTADYFSLMILNNGVADYYPDIRSVLDIAMSFKNLKKTDIAENHDSLKRFVNLWYFLSYHLFNLPDSTGNILTGKYQRYLSKRLLHDILSLKARRRILFIQYSYFNIRIGTRLKEKYRQLMASVHFLLTPNGNDITSMKLPFYFMYYITKPFRLIYNLFSRK